jgi:hypothetical protein
LKGWSDLKHALRAQAVHENDVALVATAAGAVVVCIEEFVSTLGPTDLTAPEIQVNLTLPRSVHESAWQCLRFCLRLSHCARVAAFFPNGLSTMDFIRLHDEQWDAGRPPLAEDDFLGRRLSENTRKFIDARKGEDFRALAACLAHMYLAALRLTVNEGKRLMEPAPPTPAGTSQPRTRIAVSAAAAIITAARRALRYMDELAGLKNIEQAGADAAYATWQFLVQRGFGGSLPAATVEDWRRLQAELDREDPVGPPSSDAHELPDSQPSSDQAGGALSTEAGGFRYKGKFKDLTGKALQVLTRLVGARNRAVNLAQLRDAFWTDEEVGDETIHSAVAAARNALRDAMRTVGDLGRDQDCNPIPAVDRGAALAWRIDLAAERRPKKDKTRARRQ